MSRHEETLTNGVAIAYGLDHACGPFVQVWTPDDDEVPHIDLDGMFDGLTLEHCIDIAEKHGARGARILLEESGS